MMRLSGRFAQDDLHNSACAESPSTSERRPESSRASPHGFLISCAIEAATRPTAAACPGDAKSLRARAPASILKGDDEARGFTRFGEERKDTEAKLVSGRRLSDSLPRSAGWVRPFLLPA